MRIGDVPFASSIMPVTPHHTKIAPFEGAQPEPQAGEASEMEAWRQCYREMGAKLLLYARQFLESAPFTSPHEAEDVVQTAFVRFWKMFPKAHSEHYGLLFAAVKSVALDTLRSARRRALRQDCYSAQIVDFRDPAAVEASRNSWFQVSSDQQLKADRIQEALQQIPVEQREIIVLKVWGEMTFSEIADSLDESANTVASRYRLGVQALKKRLSTHGYVDL